MQKRCCPHVAVQSFDFLACLQFLRNLPLGQAKSSGARELPGNQPAIAADLGIIRGIILGKSSGLGAYRAIGVCVIII